MPTSLFTKAKELISGKSLYHGLDSEVAGRLRAQQTSSIIKVTPLMLLANFICSATLVFTLYGGFEANPIFQLSLLVWAACLWVLCSLGLKHALHQNKNQTPEFVSERAVRKAESNAISLAAFWAIIPVFFYPAADFHSKMIIISVISGMMGGGAISLYVMPGALRDWVTVITIGCVIGTLQSGTYSDYVLLLLLATYGISLIKGGTTISHIFAGNVQAEIESTQKSETIGVLLGDFSENSSDWLWETNTKGDVVLGHKEFKQCLGESFQNIVDPDAVSQFSGLNKISSRFENREHFKDMFICYEANGQENWVKISGKPLEDRLGEFQGYRGVASNVTETRKAEKEVAFLAQNDALTGLVNRMHFTQLVEMEFDKTDNNEWALLCMDLDGFKQVNDTYGHAVGDQILTEFAKRVKNLVPNDFEVARIGGDEFTVLAKNIESKKALSDLIQTIIEETSKRYFFEALGVGAQIGVSVGVAIGHKDASSTNTLMNNADLALYRAKSEGKGTYRFFEPEMDKIVKDLRRLEADLRQAVKNNSFTVSYQPLVSYDGQQTTGFEALARWNHPETGNIPPGTFIPIAENIGLISEIGDFVLKRACEEAADWPENLMVSVNLSPQQFHNNRIVDSVRDTLEKTGLDPKRLELEITEGLFMEQTDMVIDSLNELKEMGVSIAMDDFGTGYSSLSYLLKFPFDKLKIDQSFIQSIDKDEVARNLLEAITKLGGVLNLKVTVEGVETAPQMQALEGLECASLQGFLFGKPIEADGIPAFLLSQTALTMAEVKKIAPSKDKISEASS